MGVKNTMVAAPAADVTSYATLYSTGATTTAIISTLAICNTSASPALYRIGFDTTAGTPLAANGEFLAYDATLAPNDTAFITVGIAVKESQFLRVSASSVAVNFIAMISEVTT